MPRKDTTFSWHRLRRVGTLVVYRVRAPRGDAKKIWETNNHTLYTTIMEKLLLPPLHLYIANVRSSKNKKQKKKEEKKFDCANCLKQK